MAVKSVGNFANEFSDHVEHIKIVIEPDDDREWILPIMAPQWVPGEIPNRCCLP